PVIETIGLNLRVSTVIGTVRRIIDHASMVSRISKCSKRSTSSVYRGSRKKICQNMIQNPEKMIRNAMKRKLANTKSMSRNTLPNVRVDTQPAGAGGSPKNTRVPTRRSSSVTDETSKTN